MIYAIERISALAALAALALALPGCIMDIQEDCAECVCDDGLGDCGPDGDGAGDADTDGDTDGDTDEAGPESYWDEHECDQAAGDDPCQQAICEAIEDYLDVLAGCQETAESDCDCTYLDECMVGMIDCIGLVCVDAAEHDAGAMVECALDFTFCIDPC